MATTVVFPYAKINIGLHVLNKRPDGYHNIRTLFYPTHLKDVLEVTDGQPTDSPVRLYTYGLPIPGEAEDNLCVRAYNLLAKDYPLTPVCLHLYKQIPAGAGLGGGSSDAAFCLMALNKHFQLQLLCETLKTYGALLGSDVPFFLQSLLDPQPFLASGRGESLTPYSLDLSEYHIVLRIPPVQVSTARAYASLTLKEHPVPLEALLARPVTQWRDVVANDFEPSVFAQYPLIASYKEELYQQGAVYAAMTGSGAAVYGIFHN